MTPPPVLANLAFLHAVHVLSRPSMCRLCATKWDDIIEARQRHHELKLQLADVARKQRQSESLQQYMRLDAEFLELIRRDDEMRARIARLITIYFEEQRRGKRKSSE